MPAPTPHRVGRGDAPSASQKRKPTRVKTHKFRAQDFVRKRVNESVMDHYALGKLLGDGQFGEVFKGTVRKSNGGKGDNRAIKRIQKELLTIADHEEVFNEFTLLKQMDHPNICKMYEFFEDKDNFWFVQELCSGGELLDELERIDIFTEAAAGLIMKQVLSSVHYCHKKKVVHRDLKLENILLEEGAGAKNGDEYNPMIVKVIDFGLATTFTEDQVLTSPVGSMHYIAPEVLEQEYKGGTCDIWSCGVIAYIMLCGYAPFDAGSDQDMRELIMMGHVSFKDPVWDSISQEARDFVSYLLTYEPEKRPTAVQALQHPWIQNASKAHAQQFKATKSGTDAAVQLLSNCRSFEAASKLKQVTCAFMTSQLVLSGGDEEDPANALLGDATATMIGEIFRAMDLDSDGRISPEELRRGFQDFIGDQDMTVEEVDDIFQRLDLSCTKFIDYSEFVVACMGLNDLEQAHHQQLLKQAFERLMDKNGSGFISHDKLRKEMTPFYGDDVEESIIQKIIDQADADKDGQISWSDFQAMMSKTADFVPPADATPLASYKAGSASSKKAQSKKAEILSQPAEPTNVPVDEESIKTEPATKQTPEEAPAPASEPDLPVEDTTKTPPRPGRKMRSSVGPRARLISAIFEKNMEKNREMGMDKFSYVRKQPKTQKRKLPRTRRVNFEELTNKANTQIAFDARTKMEGRVKEIEHLMSTPGRAQQRQATLVSMLQQEKQDGKRATRLQELEHIKSQGDTNQGRRASLTSSWNANVRKLELERRELRSEELKRVKESLKDDHAAKKRLFESWHQANQRPSMEAQQTSRVMKLKKFKDIFELPEKVKDKSEEFASRRMSMPTSAVLRRPGRSWSKRVSLKCHVRDEIKKNTDEGSFDDRRVLDRSASRSMLRDNDAVEGRLAKMQPKAKTKRSARRIEPLRRMNSFDSVQEQDECDQRLDEMAPSDIPPEEGGQVPETLNIPSGDSDAPAARGRVPSYDGQAQKEKRLQEMQHELPPIRGRLSSYDSPGQKHQRLKEMQQMMIQSKEGTEDSVHNSFTATVARRQREARLDELKQIKKLMHEADTGTRRPSMVKASSPDKEEAVTEYLHNSFTATVALRQREARLKELNRIKEHKSGGAKSARKQLEEKIQASKQQHSVDPSKARSMSVMVGNGADFSKAFDAPKQRRRHSMGVPLPQHEDEKNIESDVPEKDQESAEKAEAEDVFKEGADSVSNLASGGDPNENSMVGLTHIGNASFGGSNDSIVGSISDLSTNPAVETRESPKLRSPRPEIFERSAPELGSPRAPEMVSPRVEKPAPRDPTKPHIVTPKNIPRFGAPITPRTKARNRLSMKPRVGGPGGRATRRASYTATTTSPPPMTEAQAQFLDLAKERAMKSRLPQN